MVSRIIHFLIKSNSTFTLTDYIAIKSAQFVNSNYKIVLHYKYKEVPKNNVYWENIKENVKLVRIDSDYKLTLTYKTEVLMKYGGIFMDTDMMSLKPFSDIFENTNITSNKCILFYEGDNEKVSSSLIMSNPGNIFMSIWNNALRNKSYNETTINKLLEKSDVEEFRIIKKEKFFPMCYHDPYIFSNNITKLELLTQCYTMKIWKNELMFKYIQHIDVNYFFENENLFTKMFRAFVLRIQLDDIYYQIVQKLYYSKQFDMLYKLGVDKMKSKVTSKFQHKYNELLFYYGYSCHILKKKDKALRIYGILLNDPTVENKFKEFARGNYKLLGGYDTVNNKIIEKTVSCSMLSTLNNNTLDENLVKSFNVYVLNLDRREDRWNTFKSSAKKANLTVYERFSAVDGTTLKITDEIKHLMRNNKFGGRCSLLGHLLSSKKMWEKFDKEYLIVFEDDIDFHSNFIAQLNYCMQEFIDKKMGYLYLAYTTTEKNLTETFDDQFRIYEFSSKDFTIWGGTFGYIISRKMADAFLKEIDRDGFLDPTDVFIYKHTEKGQLYATIPHIIASEYIGFTFKRYDTDIQFDVRDIYETYKFYPNKDSVGNDIGRYAKISITALKDLCNKNNKIVAFNTQGFTKSSICNPEHFVPLSVNYAYQGLYVKRDYLEKHYPEELVNK